MRQASRKPEVRIVLVRHGNRIDKDGKGSGRLWRDTCPTGFEDDPSLTKAGLVNAAATGSYLVEDRRCSLSYIFSSPFWRTAQTAAMIAEQEASFRLVGRGRRVISRKTSTSSIGSTASGSGRREAPTATPSSSRASSRGSSRGAATASSRTSTPPPPARVVDRARGRGGEKGATGRGRTTPPPPPVPTTGTKKLTKQELAVKDVNSGVLGGVADHNTTVYFHEGLSEFMSAGLFTEKPVTLPTLGLQGKLSEEFPQCRFVDFLSLSGSKPGLRQREPHNAPTTTKPSSPSLLDKFPESRTAAQSRLLKAINEIVTFVERDYSERKERGEFDQPLAGGGGAGGVVVGKRGGSQGAVRGIDSQDPSDEDDDDSSNDGGTPGVDVVTVVIVTHEFGVSHISSALLGKELLQAAKQMYPTLSATHGPDYCSVTAMVRKTSHAAVTASTRAKLVKASSSWTVEKEENKKGAPSKKSKPSSRMSSLLALANQNPGGLCGLEGFESSGEWVLDSDVTPYPYFTAHLRA